MANRTVSFCSGGTMSKAQEKDLIIRLNNLVAHSHALFYKAMY